MSSAPHESAASPRSHSAANLAEFNVVSRTKPDLLNQTDSNTALLLFLTHQLGSAHEWSSVWNRPKPTQQAHGPELSVFLVNPWWALCVNIFSGTTFSS